MCHVLRSAVSQDTVHCRPDSVLQPVQQHAAHPEQGAPRKGHIWPHLACLDQLATQQDNSSMCRACNTQPVTPAQVAVTFVPAPSFILFGQLATSAAFVQVTTLLTLFVLSSHLPAHIIQDCVVIL